METETEIVDETGQVFVHKTHITLRVIFKIIFGLTGSAAMIV